MRACFVPLIKGNSKELEKVLSEISGLADIINEKDPKSGHTALTFATTLKDIPLSMLEILLTAGANINAVSDKGRAPLSYTAQIGNEKTLRFLLDRGADPLAKDNSGQTALDHAVKAKNSACLTLLGTIIRDIALDTSAEPTRKAAAVRILGGIVEQFSENELNSMKLQASTLRDEEISIANLLRQIGVKNGASISARLFEKSQKTLVMLDGMTKIVQFFMGSLTEYASIRLSERAKGGAASSVGMTLEQKIMAEGDELMDRLDAAQKSAPSSSKVPTELELRKSIELITEMGALSEFLTQLRKSPDLQTAFENLDCKYREEIGELPEDCEVAKFFERYGRRDYSTGAKADPR